MEVLSQECLLDMAPAAFAEAPRNNVSDRYSFLPTKTVISELSNVGWMPVSATQVKARKKDNMPHVRHLIRFRENNGINSEVSPEIILLNSHNASSSLQIRFGFYRFACANGLILGEDLVETMRFRHIHYKMGDILAAIDTVKDNSESWLETIEAMKSISSGPITEEFTNRVIDRFYSRANKTWDWQAMARPKRSQDNSDTLWHLFNIVQERVMHGGTPYTLVNKRGKLMHKETQKITAPDRQLEVNQKLFDMALEYLY